ncbi:hypothetical protein JCM10908_004651 [Rhodotorula pacifica]|uniref:uncharacterized protein n=1 Tax=Rhodotorula pacifica TaxID=1495444 RepID=UPI003177A674
MSVPGYILSLDGVPTALQSDESYFSALLTPHDALLWMPYSGLSGKFFVLFESDASASKAHSLLHLTPLPQAYSGRIYTAIVGSPEFALPHDDLRTLLERIASVTAQAQQPDQDEMAGDAGPGSADADAPSTVGSAWSSSSSAPAYVAPPIESVWRGQVYTGEWTEHACAFDFRLRGIEVDDGCEMGKSYVKRILEQGIDSEYLDDITTAIIRPGLPYSDQDVIRKYNIDIRFRSETRFISFMKGDDRISLIDFAKQQMANYASVPAGHIDSVGRPYTRPYRPHPKPSASSSSWSNAGYPLTEQRFAYYDSKPKRG